MTKIFYRIVALSGLVLTLAAAASYWKIFFLNDRVQGAIFIGMIIAWLALMGIELTLDRRSR